MKKEPILLIMAGGLGSRFGGLKQIVPVGLENEIILDYSLYDAMLSGFKKAIIVIKEENKEAFDNLLKNGAGKYLDIKYAYQDLNDLPGFAIPENRTKPWGTAHAVLSSRKLIDSPFAVINSDDFYGRTCFKKLYDYLDNLDDETNYTMIGFNVENTLAKLGGVSRGICNVDEKGNLISVKEHLNIRAEGNKIIDSENTEISKGTKVSMNCWGFSKTFIKELEDRLPLFLNEIGKEDAIYAINSKDPLKAEYALPNVVDSLIKEGKAKVKVLESNDKWYGVTYKEEIEYIKSKIKEMIDNKVYPSKLWE